MLTVHQRSNEFQPRNLFPGVLPLVLCVVGSSGQAEASVGFYQRFPVSSR